MKDEEFDIGLALRNLMMDERQAKYEEECKRRYAEIETGNVFPYYNAVCKDCEYRRHLGGRCVPLYVNENADTRCGRVYKYLNGKELVL